MSSKCSSFIISTCENITIILIVTGVGFFFGGGVRFFLGFCFVIFIIIKFDSIDITFGTRCDILSLKFDLIFCLNHFNRNLIFNAI